MGKESRIITLNNIKIWRETQEGCEDRGAYLVTNLKGKDVWVPKYACEWDGGEELQIREDIALDKELI